MTVMIPYLDPPLYVNESCTCVHTLICVHRQIYNYYELFEGDF